VNSTHPDDAAPELSVVMPCLNEAQTVGGCVAKARESFRKLRISGEVVVADNGSTDGSPEVAARGGARIVIVAERGYGNALRGGIAAARGAYVVMGDSDGSYDFADLAPFLEKLRQGYELVMGNRFRGCILAGAMPAMHRFLGNPVLTAIGRLLFRSPVGDFHCGLRGFSRAAYERLALRTTGMEFASEMVVKSALLGLKVAEVPIVLYPDGRSRPSHLRAWRDGWRHLRFMLLFCPLWLFVVPGAAVGLTGLAGMLWLLPGPRRVGAVTLDVHTLLLASFLCLVGSQILVFGVFTKQFAVSEGFHAPPRVFARLSRLPLLEAGLVVGAALVLAGITSGMLAVYGWRALSFGDLDPRVTMRRVIPGVLLLTLGVQTIFASFFLSILGLRRTSARL
jgi:hypothetical protein